MILDFKLTAIEDELLRFKLTATEGELLDFDLSSSGTEAEEDWEYDKNHTLTAASHQMNVTTGSKVYGGPMEIELSKGSYVVKAVSGACNDSNGNPNFWAWHVAGSSFAIVNGFSLIATSQGYNWAATATEALNSVKGILEYFYWGGGTYKLWLPCNDTVEPTNNTGSCTINIKKIIT